MLNFYIMFTSHFQKISKNHFQHEIKNILLYLNIDLIFFDNLLISKLIYIICPYVMYLDIQFRHPVLYPVSISINSI